MNLSVVRFLFVTLAAVGCISITLVPHWRDLVAQSYSSAAEDLSKQGAEEQKEALEERLEETREESGEDALAGRWGAFLTLSYGETDRQTTEREPGFDSEITSVMIGADYRISRNLLVGGAFTYERNETEYVDNLGELDNEAVILAAYVGTTPSDNSFLDFSLSYGDQNYEGKRNIFSTGTTPPLVPTSLQEPEIVDVANSDFDGYRLTAGIGSGIDWYRGAWAFGPRASLDYVYTDVDEVVESSGGSNAIRTEGYNRDSLLFKLGVALSHASSFRWGVLSTQANFSYAHEFADDAIVLQVTNIETGEKSTFITDDPDRDTFIGSLGVAATRPNGLTFFGNVEKLFGHSYKDSWIANLGLRVEF